MDYKKNEVEDLEGIYTDVNAEPIQISYAVVRSITKDFTQVIGHGAFGVVYLGALRNGLVAVKKLSPSKDFSDTQFLVEVKCLKKINHKNIVRFLGYCADTKGLVMEIGGKLAIGDVQQRFLCFEYVPNGNLDNYLQEKTHGYEWNIRYRIIKGICEGLHYLHQLPIYHLDLKPANVLLGAQMEPKITDFGLSRCLDGNQSTIFTMNIQGTPGYMAPELIDERKISLKSDIFSLGIIMTRLLTGNSGIIPENWHELLNVDCQQVKKCVEIAQICTDHDPSKRPTISEIIYQLNETETAIQKVPDLVVSEPSHDPDTTLYQVVNRFRTLPAQTPSEYHRGPDKLPVERPKWKLAFQSPPKLPIITGKKIEDVNGNPLEVILVDVNTGEPSAVPDVLQIELVPLLGNFPRGCWNANDFQRGIVEDLEGKRPLLAGELRLTMWDGCATVNELMFTKDSLICGCMFRIGVRVVPDSYDGTRILEGTTEVFMVRERDGDELRYKWQLAFQSRPRLPICVGHKIRDVIGNPLEVILVDAETGSPSALPMLELDIQLVALREDLIWHRCNDWAANEFQKAVVEPCHGKGPILTGDIRLTMKDDGRVTVSNLQFTYGCSWVRVGVCVVSGGHSCPGRILEGITNAFIIQDGRSHNPVKPLFLALGDDVWRLAAIRWGGVFHKRLAQNNIRNVQDFLRMLAVKPDELRAIMGDGMEDDTWKITISHVRSVFPGWNVYAYRAAHATIYVNSIFDLVKVEFGGVECPLQQLDEAQKRFVQQAMRYAYEHRHSLREVKLTWKLAFKSPPRLPIHTGSRIVDVTGNPLEIIVVDAKTGSPSALPMALPIQLVPLFGDFPPYDSKEDWSAEEFKAAIAKPRQKNVPLLKGSHCFNNIMKDGCVTVKGFVQFTDDSSWVRCRKFRIGAYIVPDKNDDSSCRIVEAVTEAFVVEDLNRKHYPPILGDPVWRLEMIDKDGAVHRKLMSNNIGTVQEFLWMQNVKEKELRTIMGDGMEDNAWEEIARHTRDCVIPGDKVYAYSAAHTTIYVNSIFYLVKVEFGGVECPLQQLDESQNGLMQQAMQDAYEHRHSLQEVKLTLKLAFKSPPRLPIHTGSRITDSAGNPLEIILVDKKTGAPWALPIAMEIELVPLFGDFPPYDGKEDWSPKEFRAAIVKPRQKNVPLLKGGYYFRNIMKDGRVTMSELLQFTDDSSWVRCRKFRIGAHVVSRPSYDDGSCRIAEAVTEAFMVEDLSRKHYPPVLGDPVWRLEMIDKDGAVHRKLTSNNIDTVQEFLRMQNVKEKELRTIVGDDMTGEMWGNITHHARGCDPEDKVYAYSGANGTIYVDSVFGRIFKIVIDGVECSLPWKWDKAKKMLVRQLILEAYEHRQNLQDVGADMELNDDDTIAIWWLQQWTYDMHNEKTTTDHEDRFRKVLLGKI